MRFSQRKSPPDVVQHQRGLDDDADPARAQGDMTQSPPALLEPRGGAVLQDAQTAHQSVISTNAGIQRAGNVGRGRRGVRMPIPAPT